LRICVGDQDKKLNNIDTWSLNASSLGCSSHDAEKKFTRYETVTSQTTIWQS